MKRNLSGMFFRSKDLETGRWINLCFEDLSREEQEKILKEGSPVFNQGIALRLAEVLKKIGDDFDIVAGELNGDDEQ